MLPLLTQEEVRHPRLQDYLEKPRLHGSTMSGLQQQSCLRTLLTSWLLEAEW